MRRNYTVFLWVNVVKRGVQVRRFIEAFWFLSSGRYELRIKTLTYQFV